MLAIDLNIELGENSGTWRKGNDSSMLDVLNSANIACGFHIGDPAAIPKTWRSSTEPGMAVSAHVGYPDFAGFGCRDIDPGNEELIGDVIYQIGTPAGPQECCRWRGGGKR